MPSSYQFDKVISGHRVTVFNNRKCLSVDSVIVWSGQSIDLIIEGNRITDNSTGLVYVDTDYIDPITLRYVMEGIDELA